MGECKGLASNGNGFLITKDRDNIVDKVRNVEARKGCNVLRGRGKQMKTLEYKMF